MDDLRIYPRLIRISFHSLVQYRADFLTGLFGIVAINACNLGLIGILVSRFVHLGGWSIWQVVFLYSLWILGHSVYSLFFWHLSYLEEFLLEGTFDRFLIRPASPLVQLLGAELQVMGIVDVVVGVAGLTLAYRNLQLHWGPGLWAFFGLALLSGAAIETALSWLVACLAFWTGRSYAAYAVVARLSYLVQQYPLDIFGPWFRVVVTGVIPVAFINYYPSLLLLGKAAASGPWRWLALASPLAALGLLGVSATVWRLGLSRYSSSGS